MWETQQVRRGLVLVFAIALLLLLARSRRGRAREALRDRLRPAETPEEAVTTSTGVAAVGQVEKQEEPRAGPPESPGTTAPSL